MESTARILLGLFFHSPLFHKHLVTSCTNQKIKAETGVQIFVKYMGVGGGGRKSWEPVHSLHSPNRAMSPAAGALRKRRAGVQAS
jgi:hypothetical protein